MFLECHTLEQEYFGLKNLSTNADVESDARAEEASKESGEVTDFDQALTNSPVEQETTEHNLDVTSPFLLWMTFARRKEVWTKIFTKLVYNPVIWGVVFGFMLSLSTIGPTYLSPTSPDYLKPLGWIWTTSGWLGDCVSPVSLVTMGVWMQDQGKRMFQIPLRDAFLFMVSKLVLVPLMALGLAKAFDLENEAGRAAVLIAALPISLASFSLGSKYEIGESILSANVSLGTLLMLPTIIIWILVMDAADVFPIA